MQALGKFIVYTDYLINKDYIAKNLCINKVKPKLKCNGKCHLAKQLKKQDEKENSSTSSKDKFEVIYHQQNSSSIEFCTVIQVIEKLNFSHYKNEYAHTYLSNVFQPPQV